MPGWEGEGESLAKTSSSFIALERDSAICYLQASREDNIEISSERGKDDENLDTLCLIAKSRETAPVNRMTVHICFNWKIPRGHHEQR